MEIKKCLREDDWHEGDQSVKASQDKVAELLDSLSEIIILGVAFKKYIHKTSDRILVESEADEIMYEYIEQVKKENGYQNE